MKKTLHIFIVLILFNSFLIANKSIDIKLLNYQIECAEGLMKSCHKVAVHYDTIDVQYRNIQKAITNYEIACQNALTASCYNLANIFKDGQGVAKDILKAKELFKIACNAGDNDSCQELQILNQQELERESFRQLNDIADLYIASSREDEKLKDSYGLRTLDENVEVVENDYNVNATNDLLTMNKNVEVVEDAYNTENDIVNKFKSNEFIIFIFIILVLFFIKKLTSILNGTDDTVDDKYERAKQQKAKEDKELKKQLSEQKIKTIHQEKHKDNVDALNQVAAQYIENTAHYDKIKPIKEYGFTWWTTWGVLGITFGNILILGSDFRDSELLWLIPLNSILNVFIIMKNKYAFLIVTILSGPIMWIINGIYLKNRWNHPEINKAFLKLSQSNKILSKSEESLISENHFNALINIQQSLVILGSAVFISWFFFLNGYGYWNPSDSLGVNILGDIFSISYKYETTVGIMSFFIFSYLWYKLLFLLLGWLKYTKISLAMEDKYQDIYNYHLPKQNKSIEFLPLIALSVVFEEARKNKLNSLNLTYLLQRLSLDSSLNKIFHSNPIESNAYESLYRTYNDFRAMNHKPLISTILASKNIGNDLSDNELAKVVQELKNNPIVSDSSGI